ncbi:MAG TPA: hypothetical protein VK081_04720 [Planctomycetota bacterium]|nr:hypothetical protein [Planctomycetota bacterium]
MQRSLCIWVVFAASALGQSWTVPAAFASTDATGLGAVPGFTQRFRQQAIYGASLLTPLAGHAIREIRFRRDGQFAGALGAGRARLTVRMSATTRAVLQTSPMFADNHGSVVTVFQGMIDLPASPALTHRDEPTWTSPHAVTIPLSTSFHYTGGQLALDIEGQPDAANRTRWWPIDQYMEPIIGTAASVGTACDGRNDLNVAADQLVPGASVRFVAGGAPLSTSVLAIAPARMPAVDLGFLGYPGCTLHVPLDVLLTRPVSAGFHGSGGAANHVVQLPAHGQLLGAPLAIQAVSVWLEGQTARLATSPALDLTLAGRLPQVDVAMVTSVLLGDTDPAPEAGRVYLTRAPVVQFGW